MVKKKDFLSSVGKWCQLLLWELIQFETQNFKNSLHLHTQKITQ